jgi:hypothetical protein
MAPTNPERKRGVCLEAASLGPRVGYSTHYIVAPLMVASLAQQVLIIFGVIAPWGFRSRPLLILHRSIDPKKVFASCDVGKGSG